MTTEQKYQVLKSLIRQMKGAVVAFSGGVDSSFLTQTVYSVLGDRSIAVIAQSPSFPRWEFEEAVSLARTIGIRHEVIQTDELSNPNYSQNPKDRCYYCKKTLFKDIQHIANREGMGTVIEGSNYDDRRDYRPGMKAVRELGIRSPLQEAELTKSEIRQLSHQNGLPTWDKPSYACLASRFPYNTEINPEKLEQVERAEELLREMSFRYFRVRHHGDTARIEVAEDDIETLAAKEQRQRITREFKKLGFIYVALDLNGYRMGSMNEVLDTDDE